MRTRKIFGGICLSLAVLSPLFAEPLYIGLGPSYGCYRAGDGWNDRVGVDARLRWQRFALIGELYYKNEHHANDAVWVKSWPLTLSGAVYPIDIIYIGGGIGSHELYVDYDQSIEGMERYENENRRRVGTQLFAGFEIPITKTAVLLSEVQYNWIDYHLRPLPGRGRPDTNALSIKATMIFKLGVER